MGGVFVTEWAGHLSLNGWVIMVGWGSYGLNGWGSYDSKLLKKLTKAEQNGPKKAKNY